MGCFFDMVTNEKCLALFPTGTIYIESHHRESSTCRVQDRNLRRT